MDFVLIRGQQYPWKKTFRALRRAQKILKVKFSGQLSDGGLDEAAVIIREYLIEGAKIEGKEFNMTLDELFDADAETDPSPIQLITDKLEADEKKRSGSLEEATQDPAT